MRVLFISGYYKPAFMYGGPVNFSSSLCEVLTQLGVDVNVFTTNAYGKNRLDTPSDKAVIVNGVPVWYFPLLYKNNYFFSTRFFRALTENGKHFDIIITETVWGYLQIPITRVHQETGIPYVIPLHGQLLPWSLSQKKIKKHLYLNLFGKRFINHAAALVCSDPEEADALSSFEFRPPRIIIPIGIDLDKYSGVSSNGTWRKKYQIPPTATVFLFVGRLHPKKKPDLAVLTLIKAVHENIDAHLILAGPDEGGIQVKLLEMARLAGCEKRIHFTGLISDQQIVDAYTDADLLLMPSEPQSENFGVSASEALACGLAVLTSDGVPVGKWAESAGAGMRVSTAGDEFIKTAISLAREPDKLSLMGRNGRDLAREMFDIKKSGALWFAHLQEISKNKEA
jgi:glycosyltransferase involved in cell wall biosynthesis